LETREIFIEERDSSEARGATETPCAIPTGNLLPLLHEIRHALLRWLESGQIHTIDLRCLPTSPAEEASLLQLLGRGEVEARITTLGKSDVFETRIAGVWIVDHYSDSETPVGRFIEICSCPSILQTQREDAELGVATLGQLIATEENL
jgi:hydrogenase-1 operon protein HyaF